MTHGVAEAPARRLREEEIAEALRGEWRLFEHVALTGSAGGRGFHATIYLNPTIVRGSLEQQGLNGSPAALTAAENRRAKAISDCVERFNAKRPKEEAILTYEVVC